MLVRSLVVAAFLCLLGFVPSASADPCPSPRPVPRPHSGATLPPGGLACGDLHGMDLLQVELAGADLHGADLRDVTLTQATLSGADLSGANLTRAELGQADLTHANLRDATLAGARLIQTELAGADLRGADLRDADLSQANLRDADLRGADLTGAEFTQATVTGVDVRGATLDDISAVEVFGLKRVRVDPVSPGGYVQVAYLLIGPAVAIALLWWRRRFRHLMRHNDITPVRAGALVSVGVGVPIAVAGLYLLACGAVRGIAAGVAGWFWAVDPGPLGVLGMADPVRQLEVGGAAVVVSAFVLAGARRGRPTGEAPVDGGQLAVGQPSPGRPYPPLAGGPRGFAGLLATLGMLDLVVTFVLWLLGLLPSDGVWGANGVVGHLAVVGVATVVFIRAAQPAPQPGVPKALTGIVLVPGAYVFLSGTTAKSDPTSGPLPWESLQHVHLIRTLGSEHSRTAMVTIQPPGRSAVEYPNELKISRAQAERLRAALPADTVSELVRAPSSD